MAAPIANPTTVIFDIGNVLVDWNPRFLYEKLIAPGEALDAFLREVVTTDWHFQHDAGRPLAETVPELTTRFPEHAELIAAWGPRFNESIRGALPGMEALVADLDRGGVPLYAITNFSGELFPPFRADYPALFDAFRDIVVSGDEKLTKPDAAIYRLALDRFGVAAGEAVFVDDRADNVAGAEAIGMRGIVFTGADDLRHRLRALGLPV